MEPGAQSPSQDRVSHRERLSAGGQAWRRNREAAAPRAEALGGEAERLQEA